MRSKATNPKKRAIQTMNGKRAVIIAAYQQTNDPRRLIELARHQWAEAMILCQIAQESGNEKSIKISRDLVAKRRQELETVKREHPECHGPATRQCSLLNQLK